MKLPKRAGDSPLAISLEEGKKYAWCACGLSDNQPFCNGNHKGSEFSPYIFTADKTETKYLCNCKSTKGRPFCDGSHK